MLASTFITVNGLITLNVKAIPWPDGFIHGFNDLKKPKKVIIKLTIHKNKCYDRNKDAAFLIYGLLIYVLSTGEDVSNEIYLPTFSS